MNNLGWEFTKTIILFALVGKEVIITNSRYVLVVFLTTSNARSLNDCYFNRRFLANKEARNAIVGVENLLTCDRLWQVFVNHLHFYK